MKGLYFYKLLSPYSEDVTKDCKLTVNEIDHNFVTLKDADIKEFAFDENSNVISLTRNNGDKMMLDLSPMIEGITRDFKVDYDSICGTITIEYNGEIHTISGLITRDNIYSEAITEVITDGSLNGLGSKKIPLGIAAVEKTGTYKPAIKLIDRTLGEFMPNECHLKKGDRYVTYEYVSDYGYLYDYRSIKDIDKDLKHGWRVPTKEDWDNMLNAIEPCDEFRNHDSALANNILGKFAGKFLKAKDFWKKPDGCVNIKCECDVDDEIFDVEDFGSRKKPQEKKHDPCGVDSFGLRVMPAGFYDGCEITDYFQKRGIYWSKTMISETDVYVKRFDYNKSGVIQNVESPRNFFSLKLVKDYDGSNHNQVEHINGLNYNTVLMPSLNTKHGYTIWTVNNVYFEHPKYNFVQPNNGDIKNTSKFYYINEWNGFFWEKKQILEGESIVLLQSGDCKEKKNIEYRVIDGVLCDVSKLLHDTVVDEIGGEIDKIEDIVGDGLTDGTLTDKIIDLDKNLGEGFIDENGNVISITEVLNKEIEDRVSSFETLNTLITETSEKLEEEVRQREESDTLIQENIEVIKESIEEIEVSLKIETETRIEEDNNIKNLVGLTEDGELVIPEDSNYISESDSILDAIVKLDNVLVNKEANIEDLKSALEEESKVREEEDNKLFARLIKTEQPIDAVDFANGVITLHTEDSTYNIKINFNGDYGVFPYNG